MSRGVRDDIETLRAREKARSASCSECKVTNDHTWWCRISPDVLPDGTRPYYWRES